MEHVEKAATITSTINVPSSPLIIFHKFPTNSCSSPRSSPKSPNPKPTNHVVVSPCAACKILRRRCDDKCVLAPYFPPSEPYKFTIAHRVFGASNIIKFLQDLPENQRADAVSSMVYEANARIRDPVYGCAGAICHLQNQISELQAQLAKSQAELVNVQCQQANLIALLCMEMNGNGSNPDPISQEQQVQLEQQQQQRNHQEHHHQYLIESTCFLDENNLGTCWEPLWT